MQQVMVHSKVMQWAKHKQYGFTIVELLIVIVVIGILAAITIVAFNGVQNRAKEAKLQSELGSVAKALELAKTSSTAAQYPSSLTGLDAPIAGVGYFYDSTDDTYCVRKADGTIIYNASSADPVARVGDCGTNGLVSAYRLNNNLNDSVGSGPVGSGTAITSVAGQGGTANTAYSFNGSSSAITLNSAFSLNSPGFSMSTWFYSAAASNLGSFVKMGVGNGGVALGMGGASFSAAGNNLGMLYENRRWIMSTRTVSANTWHHAAMTVDESGLPTLYFNGEKVASYPGVAPIRDGTQSVVGGYGDRFFNGRLDDVRFFNRVLTSGEVKGMHAAGAQ